MKILISAYACRPSGGSELAVGMRVVEAAASLHNVWVLTQPAMALEVQAEMRARGLGDRVTVIGVPPDVGTIVGGVRGLLCEHWAHDRWQRSAQRIARDLDAEHDFDVVHHATLAAYWLRVGVAALGKPLVWGPVGGGVNAPLTLLPALGMAGMAEDLIRAMGQRVLADLFSARRGFDARVAFVQNAATAARLRPEVGATIVPNPLAATVPAPAASRRREDIAMVGRLTPWKAATLGVAAMRYVTHPNAVLRIYGTGRNQARVERAIRRYGVADRVRFEGLLPHEDLLQQVAGAGALLHPALHEEGGFAVAEALSLGTPVVALAHGGPAELVKEWPSSPATLIEPRRLDRTARAMAEALDAYLAHPAPIPAAPLRPRRSFADEVLAAYERAALTPPRALVAEPLLAASELVT